MCQIFGQIIPVGQQLLQYGLKAELTVYGSQDDWKGITSWDGSSSFKIWMI